MRFRGFTRRMKRTKARPVLDVPLPEPSDYVDIDRNVIPISDIDDPTSLLLAISMKTGACGLSYNANLPLLERTTFTIFDGERDHVWQGADDLSVLRTAWAEVQSWEK